MDPVVQRIARLVADEHGQALLVGGCVRDALLGLPRKDHDLEVFGLDARALERLLRRHFEVIDVGRSFGVLKIRGRPIDVSLPRRETKSGPGHRGFDVDTDPNMSLAEAASRRDLTINAIYEDPLSGELLDPLGGRRDLTARILRHCSPRFAEDPLRVLRVMQFRARFEFAVAAETTALCQTLDLSELPVERVGDEFRKLIDQGRRPSLGLEFLARCKALRFFPELLPFADEIEATGRALDDLANARQGDDSDWLIGLALLCLPLAAESREGLLRRITHETRVVAGVLALCSAAEPARALLPVEPGDEAVRRLACRAPLTTLTRLLAHAGVGRGDPLAAAQASRLRAHARRLGVADAPPAPLLLGRHLQQLGLSPGPAFGRILQQCFEAQLRGAFATESEALAYLRQLLKEPPGPAAPAS